MGRTVLTVGVRRLSPGGQGTFFNNLGVIFGPQRLKGTLDHPVWYYSDGTECEISSFFFFLLVRREDLRRKTRLWLSVTAHLSNLSGYLECSMYKTKSLFQSLGRQEISR